MRNSLTVSAKNSESISLNMEVEIPPSMLLQYVVASITIFIVSSRKMADALWIRQK